MINTLLFATLALGLGGLHAEGTGPRLHARYAPYVQVWLNNDGYYHRGDRVRVSFETDEDAYVTIFRVDTDGRVRVLFPHNPWHDNYVRGRRRYDVIEPYGNHGKRSFVVDEYPGQGYVFAIASLDPFDYSAFTRRDHWDHRAIAYDGRVTGDPYVAFDDIVDRILPYGYEDYTYDISPYYVERRYAYPRFLCYDCHAYVGYTHWNPYRYSCVQFRLVIYDDPYYYPARIYAGTRVVYKRPVRYEPRYVFKDRVASRPFVEHERRRPATSQPGRRTVDRGATSRDVGGVGRLPAPVTRAPDRASDEGDRFERRRVAPENSRVERTPDVEHRRPVSPEVRRRTEERRDSTRPQLERREPTRRSEPSPPRDPEVRDKRDERVPSARSAPERREAPSARSRAENRPTERPQVQQAPKRKKPSSKQVRQGKRPERRAAPARQAQPERKPRKKPKKRKKDSS